MVHKKTYPSPEVLKSYWWYRLCQVLFWTIIVLSAVAGFYNGGGFIVDAVTAAGINGAILYAVWRLVLYIAYGQRPLSKEEAEHRSNTAKTAVAALVAFAVWIFFLYIMQSYE